MKETIQYKDNITFKRREDGKWAVFKNGKQITDYADFILAGESGYLLYNCNIDLDNLPWENWKDLGLSADFIPALGHSNPREYVEKEIKRIQDLMNFYYDPEKAEEDNMEQDLIRYKLSKNNLFGGGFDIGEITRYLNSFSEFTLVHKDGKILFDKATAVIGFPSDNLQYTAVKHNGRYYLMKFDKDSKELITVKELDRGMTIEGGVIFEGGDYLLVKNEQDEKYAIFDKDGNKVSEWFDYIYREGLLSGESDYYAIAERDKKYIYHKSGKLIAGGFNDFYEQGFLTGKSDYLLVFKDTLLGQRASVIDREGRYITGWHNGIFGLSFFEEGGNYFVVEKDGKLAVFDKEGRQRTDYYDEIDLTILDIINEKNSLHYIVVMKQSGDEEYLYSLVDLESGKQITKWLTEAEKDENWSYLFEVIKNGNLEALPEELNHLNEKQKAKLKDLKKIYDTGLSPGM